MEIKSELINDKFVSQMQGKQTFAAYAKIKSNVKGKPIPNISRDDLIYYQHNFKQSFFRRDVSNIDLNCAYATVLFNDDIITKETMAYLLRLPKQARLVSVGMLASRKKTFSYKQGVITDYDEYVSELSPFFYLAVKRTFEVMSELKKILANDYLFTWVDGIYFVPNTERQAACEAYLESIKFGYKSEALQNFQVDFLARKILLTFKKYSPKKMEWEQKIFNLPHKETFTEKIALSIIKHNQNEKIIKSRITR